jgi:phospholipase/carboxylesterase
MTETYPLHTDLSLPYLVRGSLAPDPALLLLLHGIGSNEHDLMGLEPLLSKRFHVVSARSPLELGLNRFGFFSVTFAPGPVHNAGEAEEGRLTLLDFIDELGARYGVPHDRIFLMGFSQGAIMSFSVALTTPERVGGIVAMSGRILQEIGSDTSRLPDHGGLPVLVTHGVHDTKLPIEHGRASRDTLAELNIALDYREYGMGHEIGRESLGDIIGWLEQRFSAPAPAPRGE